MTQKDVERIMRRINVDRKSAISTLKEMYRQQGRAFQLPDTIQGNGREFSVYYAMPQDRKSHTFMIGNKRFVLV